MSFVQLELDLWEQLAIAEEDPEQTNLEQLFLGLDLVLEQGSPQYQLATAGEAFVQIADLFCRRADILLKGWKQAQSEEGPVLDFDELEGLVRQSMVFELDDLMEEPVPVTRRSFTDEDVESVVAIVEKGELLKALEGELEESEHLLDVIEDEDVGAWVELIQEWFESQGENYSDLSTLLQATGLGLIRVWIAVLLGDFEVRQIGGFYVCNTIQVRSVA